MATPNYGYEKRQRELAKKKKKEDKARAKAAGKPYEEGDDASNADAPEDQTAPPAAGEGSSNAA